VLKLFFRPGWRCRVLARFPKTPKVAVAYVALLAMVASLLS